MYPPTRKPNLRKRDNTIIIFVFSSSDLFKMSIDFSYFVAKSKAPICLNQDILLIHLFYIFSPIFSTYTAFIFKLHYVADLSDLITATYLIYNLSFEHR